MAQQELIRCIHTDKKTGRTKVVFLAPSVVGRTSFMKNYGYRVEHIPKTTPIEEVEEANKRIPVDVPPITGIVPEEPVSMAGIPTVEFIETPEPVTTEETTAPVAEGKTEKRKYAKAKPTKVTNK